MPRPTFQDIIPPERRSIKKVTLPNRASHTHPAGDYRSGNPRPDDYGFENPPVKTFSPVMPPGSGGPQSHSNPAGGKGRGKKIFIITGILVIVLAAAASTVYSIYRSGGAVVRDYTGNSKRDGKRCSRRQFECQSKCGPNMPPRRRHQHECRHLDINPVPDRFFGTRRRAFGTGYDAIQRSNQSHRPNSHI